MLKCYSLWKSHTKRKIGTTIQNSKLTDNQLKYEHKADFDQPPIERIKEPQQNP